MDINAIRPKVFATETQKLQELFAQRNKLLNEIRTIEGAIQAEAKTTPQYAFIKGLASGDVRFNGIDDNAIAFEISVHALDQRNIEKAPASNFRAAYKPTSGEKIAQLGTAAINQLLNGKFLRDGEKRRLVSAMLPDGIIDGTTSSDTASE